MQFEHGPYEAWTQSPPQGSRDLIVSVIGGIQAFDFPCAASASILGTVQLRSIVAIAGLALCGLTPASGEVATPAQPAEFSEQFLHAKLDVWQKRLQLESWNISIHLTRRSDLKAKTLGGIRWDKKKQTAVIAVMDPADYAMPVPEMLADMEFTLVHELIHLELASLPKSEASRSNEEFAVNRIAEALLGR